VIDKNQTTRKTSMSKYTVKLTQEQRTMVEEIVKKEQHQHAKFSVQNVLLKQTVGAQGLAGPRNRFKRGWSRFNNDQSVRKRFVEKWHRDAISRREQPEKRPEKRKN